MVVSGRYTYCKHADHVQASHEGTDVSLCVSISALAAVIHQHTTLSLNIMICLFLNTE